MAKRRTQEGHDSDDGGGDQSLRPEKKASGRYYGKKAATALNEVRREYRDKDWTGEVAQFAEPLKMHDAAYASAGGSASALKARKTFHGFYRPRVQEAIEDREQKDYELVLQELRAHFSRSSLALPGPETPPPPVPVAGGEVPQQVPLKSSAKPLTLEMGFGDEEDERREEEPKEKGNEKPKKKQKATVDAFDNLADQEAAHSAQVFNSASLVVDGTGQPELAQLLKFASQMSHDRGVMMKMVIELVHFVKGLYDLEREKNADSKSASSDGGPKSRKLITAVLEAGFLQQIGLSGLFPKLEEKGFEEFISSIGGDYPMAKVKRVCKKEAGTVRKFFAKFIRDHFTALILPHVPFPVQPKKAGDEMNGTPPKEYFVAAVAEIVSSGQYHWTTQLALQYCKIRVDASNPLESPLVAMIYLFSSGVLQASFVALCEKLKVVVPKEVPIGMLGFAVLVMQRTVQGLTLKGPRFDCKTLTSDMDEMLAKPEHKQLIDFLLEHYTICREGGRVVLDRESGDSDSDANSHRTLG